MGEAKASGNLGNTLKVLGRFDEAVVCCQRHLDIAQEQGDKVGRRPPGICRAEAWPLACRVSSPSHRAPPNPPPPLVTPSWFRRGHRVAWQLG